jgi:hypothetical protein
LDTELTNWTLLDVLPTAFQWPSRERNAYLRGLKCSFDGRNVEEMTREQLILFIAHLDRELTRLTKGTEEDECKK